VRTLIGKTLIRFWQVPGSPSWQGPMTKSAIKAGRLCHIYRIAAI